MADHDRAERIAHSLHAEIAHLLRREVKDPRVTAVSITGVHLSRDLSVARIRWVTLGGLGDVEQVAKGLDRASGYLRGAVARRLRMRHAPELRWEHDEGLDESVRMAGLLEGLSEERRAAAAEEAAGTTADAVPQGEDER